MMEHWYKNAIVYSLDVETFYDSNGDGVGDFQGLTQKLHYIASLGINCIWLLPFYLSPNRDNGYDVMDYYSVDPRLGTLGDFAEFMRAAKDLGIWVIVDLVVNHTSDQHHWFKEARKDPYSKYRDFYVWSDEPLPVKKDFLMFEGEEDGVWTYDKVAKQYYMHRFYKEQPDLNISNPEVRAEILKIMGFWLALGVSGFRVDAAEMLIESYGLRTKEDLVIVLEEMREYVDNHTRNVILIAEANVRPAKMNIYLNEGTRMHMLFNFYVNQHLFVSVARENPGSLIEALLSLPEVHASHQWLNFLRHHDELTLRLLNKRDREQIFKKFAPEEHMRIYSAGIRRRLAPMLNWDKDLLRMIYSLLFALPGAPLIRYGDEIAMGDDLKLPGRTSVRTPMQWSDDENGGFSEAPKKKLVKPVISREKCGYKDINVLDAQGDPDSLFNWLKRLISVRKQCPEIGFGVMNIIECKLPHVLIHAYDYKGKRLLLLHNFSAKPVALPKEDTGIGDAQLKDIFSQEPTNNKNQFIELGGYGYKWLRVH